LRQYYIPQPLLERFIEGFVCGKLRYFTPILGAETCENSEILKPLMLAYKELMRTETGAVHTTPIPLLQAGTRRPSLLNMIASDTTNLVMSSVANGNILGDEYVSWNGDYDGWTPLGKAWEMLRRVAPDYESVVPQTHIPRSVRDGMYKCNFRIPPTREEAIRLHSQNQLLIHSDIQLWTDGAFLASSEEGGAAYIITGRSLLDIHSSGLQQISSSYEAERAALRLGLLAIEKMECHNKHIAIYTDSQGLARQLESTPLSYKTAESPILECAEILSSLSYLNRITVCWIPSHLNIGLNDEVDVLAKHGLSARLAPAEAPLPRLNSFRLRLKRELTRITEEEIARSVKPSQFHAYPDRQPFIGTYQQGANGIRRWKPSPYTRKSRFERGIMFRVRSGHTRCQAHMHRIGIVETAAPCRLCEEETAESVEHFLFHCSSLQQQLAAPLTGLLAVADAVPPDIYSLCWTRPREVRKLLKAAEQAGAWI
jgi:ribonuclease HI